MTKERSSSSSLMKIKTNFKLQKHVWSTSTLNAFSMKLINTNVDDRFLGKRKTNSGLHNENKKDKIKKNPTIYLQHS